MARIIPSYIDDDAAPGERAVYSMLAKAPPSWTVIHSLDLAPWSGNRRTEIDFLVFIPDTGILCVEVKSHNSLGVDESGTWWPTSIRKSPFKQAMDGRYAFHRRLKEFTTYGHAIPVSHICIFPFARFQIPRTLSVMESELVDVDEFASCKTGDEFAGLLRQKCRASMEAERVKPPEHPLSPSRMDDLVRLCVPVQKRRPDAEVEIQRRRAEIDRLLTAQQVPVLRLAESNPRILVTGGAGTGKTLIALELARRNAEAGHRVGLLSYNNLIGQWLRERTSTAGSPPTLVADSAHRLLLRFAAATPPADASDIFWNEELPTIVMDRLTDPAHADDLLFDYLVVDEVQDFLARPTLFECVGALLSGGLQDGRFALFGDSEYQVLSAQGEVHAAFEELKSQPGITKWHLFENCRNYRSVGLYALTLSGYPKSIYSEYLRSGDAHRDVRFLPCETYEDERNVLDATIRELRGSGLRNSDVVVLSLCAPEKSLARRIQEDNLTPKLRDITAPGPEIPYTSVHAFKGMERSAVIVTDVDVGMHDLSRSLFYTALTRSTGVARVLCNKTQARQLISWAQGAMS